MARVNKILVVDDDPVIIKLLQNILSAQDFQVITARDGSEAMTQVKEHKPDLIVLDIMMPKINGYDVCYNLKFDSPYKNIPIILLTVRDREIDPRMGRMIGVDYMRKPVNRRALLSRIKQVLK